MQRTVAVYIPTIDGRVVQTSRKNDYNNWNFVGGKAEEHETIQECVVRETYEETGIVLEPDHLVPVYQQWVQDEYCFGFFYDDPTEINRTRWQMPGEAPARIDHFYKTFFGIFGDYNIRFCAAVWEYMSVHPKWLELMKDQYR